MAHFVSLQSDAKRHTSQRAGPRVCRYPTWKIVALALRKGPFVPITNVQITTYITVVSARSQSRDERVPNSVALPKMLKSLHINPSGPGSCEVRQCLCSGSWKSQSGCKFAQLYWWRKSEWALACRRDSRGLRNLIRQRLRCICGTSIVFQLCHVETLDELPATVTEKLKKRCSTKCGVST